MPKIPSYDSNVGINAGATPRIALPEMGLGAAKESERAQKEVVGVIEQAEDALIKVRDFRQQTEAQNYAFEKLNEIKSRADQDIDFDSTRYEAEIDSMGLEAAKTITGQLAKDEFMAGFQKQATAAKWGIKNEFRARELKSIDASIDYQGQQIVDNYGGMNEADRITSIATFRKSLENGVNIGLYNKGTANVKYAKFQKDIFKSQVKYDIYNDPATQEDDSEVLRQLRDTKDETYAFLDSTTRLDMIKESQQRIFQNNQTFKREVEVSQNQKNDTIIDKIANGTLTLKDIEKEMAIPEEQGGLKKSILLKYQTGLQGRIAKDLNYMLTEKTADKESTERAKKIGEYLKLINNYIDDKTDMWVAKELLATAWKDGVIDGKEAKVLNPIRKHLKDIEFNRSTNPAAYYIKAVKTILGKYNATDTQIALRLKQLLGTENINSQVASQIVADHIKSVIPNAPLLPKEGETHMDKNGNLFVVFPDGTIKEYAPKINGTEKK